MKEVILFTFHVHFEERVVVLNSNINGAEGKEERPIGYNFEPMKKTVVEFAPNDGHIQIVVDGQSFYNYKHRLPISSLAKVQFWSFGNDHPGALYFLGVNFLKPHSAPTPLKQYIGISQ